jgi:hypothetical protein
MRRWKLVRRAAVLALGLALPPGLASAQGADTLSISGAFRGVGGTVIACWDAKYHFTSWRLVTAIRLTDDPDWTPLLATPAHPEYVSGHSTVSAAAATVLAAYFGDATPFALPSPVAADQIRPYPSSSAALDELADARVFAGFHFRTACEDGRAIGGQVAGYILDNLMGRIHGAGESGTSRLIPRSAKNGR